MSGRRADAYLRLPQEAPFCYLVLPESLESRREWYIGGG